VIKFQVVGGRVGNATVNFPPGHKYSIGREVVLFLRKLSPIGNLTKYIKEKDVNKQKDFNYMLSGYDSLYYVDRKGGDVTLREAFSGEKLGQTEDDDVPLRRLEELWQR